MSENLSINYLVSKSVLKELLKNNLITEDEFIKIDLENRKTFNRKYRSDN